MHILVANLGSTSYKYSLFQAEGEALRLTTSGKYERVEDHGQVIEDSLRQLVEQGHLPALEALDAVGFKTVMGGDLSGCRVADDDVIEALERTAPLAPAHNPPYAAGIRWFRQKAPRATPVALFETAFYQWTTPASRQYAVPPAWAEAGVRRYGFHGASHKFVSERSAELLGREDVARRVRSLYHGSLLPVQQPPLAVISCHLGGSSSVTGIRDGLAVGTSMGLSPQSGLPQNNRVGDLDAMAVPFALRQLGLSLDEAERQLTREAGLLGLSHGRGNDLRDIEAAAQAGHAPSRLALEVLVHEIRRWASSFLFDLGRLDAIVFTGGIGENNPWLREAVCAGLEHFGLRLDPARNDVRAEEACLSPADAPAQAFVIPANEEKVVATETRRLLESQAG